MRFTLLLPLIFLTVGPPCRAGWGGPAATGFAGTTVAAPAGFSGARANVPVGVAPVNRGNIAAQAPGTGHRGPGTFSGGPTTGNGLVRYSPISANARPVGVVTSPRAPMNPNTSPAAVRPSLPGSNPALLSPSRLDRFAANADANRHRPANPPGGNLLRRPEWKRPVAAYISYPNNSPSYYGGRRPGHYVPGETYVQEAPGYGYNSLSGVSPAYYLGGAFPCFYGGAIGTYGTGPGVSPEFSATETVPAAAPGAATAPAPADNAPAVAESAGPARTPDLAGANSLVEAVQAELLRRGYFSGHPDGVFRAGTGEALRRFQENHGLASTGLVNEATLFALGLN